MGPYVALLRIELHLPDAGSLKAKRKDVQSVKAQLHGRLGVAVAETAHHDLWQRAELAGALTGGSLAHLQERCDEVCRWLDARFPEGVHVQRTLASFHDVEDVG